jgi:hypothetical protein
MILRPFIAFVVPLCLTLTGCGGTTSEVVTDPQIDQYKVVNIAVLPFSIERPTLGQERGYAAPSPPLSAAENLTDIFYRKLKDRQGLAVVPPHQVLTALAEMPAQKVSQPAFQSLGKLLGVGAVLVGVVEVYKERAGSAMGLDRPEDAAEVGFTVRLVSVKDGVPLWTGQYHERQRPANEDLTGFLQRGPRYLNVDQLADSAVENVLRKFPFGQPRTRDSAGSAAP